jgi:cytochrome P450
MKGDDVSDKGLRDDLMTMLVAGHETTAALLTWALFELSKAHDEFGKDYLTRCRAEVDEVLGDRAVPTYEDLAQLNFTRLCLVEALRLYPEPPVLIRRALDEDTLPAGGAGFEATIPRGADVFVSTWNLHRSEALWDDPLVFNPDRWAKPFDNGAVRGWKGFRPERVSGLYPDEQATDFAFLPFGGGSRRCVGDQFAMLEATVTFALLMRRFDFSFADGDEGSRAVGLRTGATIHTENGLWMTVRARPDVPRTGASWVAPVHPILNPGGNELKQQQEKDRKGRIGEPGSGWRRAP